MDEKALVRRSRHGDLTAAGELLEHYQGLAYTTALRLLGERTEAEDIAQEALIRAYTHLADLRDDDGFGPWLRRIAVNLSLNVLRRRGRLRFESLDGGDGAGAGAGAEVSEAPREFVDAGQRTPEEQALDADRLAAVDALVQRLPVEQRVSLLLRDVYDYDMTEVASLQGCGLSAAKMRVSRARAAMRQMLRETPLMPGGDGPAQGAGAAGATTYVPRRAQRDVTVVELRWRRDRSSAWMNRLYRRALLLIGIGGWTPGKAGPPAVLVP